jgi:aspartate oxidase
MLQDMIMRLESAMGMVMENLKDLRENQHGLRENQNALIQTQNTLIAMQQQTEAVGQHNTKDINQLRQQTEFKHVSGMEQIHA